MVDPIVLSPPSGEQYQTNSVSSQNWTVNPPRVYIFWMMSDPFPTSISVKLGFPDFQEIQEYENFTDFQLKVSTTHVLIEESTSPSIQFTKVNDEDIYTGDLGILADGIYSKELLFSFLNLQLLSEGQYYANSLIEISAVNPQTGQREEVSVKRFLIVFHANASSFLLSPPFEFTFEGLVMTYVFPAGITISPLVFNYYLGGSLPSKKDIYYFGLKPQNLGATSAIIPSDEAIQTSYTGLHPYYAKLAVDFSSDIESFAIGTYEYSLGLGYYGDGAIPDLIKQVPIILNVFAEPEGSLSANPYDIVFNVTVGGFIPPSPNVSLQAENDWQVISNIPEWLSVSQLSGSGNATLILTPSNFQNLPEGQYIHEMSISDGTDIVVITITMNLKVFLVTPFIPGKLYFTKDLDYLNFISQNDGIYVELTVNIKVFKNKTYEEINYERPYSIPLSNKKGDFHLGTIVHDLFDEIENFTDFVTELSGNYFSAGYKPAVVSIAYQEKQYAGSIPVELISGSINGILFIKGVSPFITQNQLSLLTAQQQFLSRISKNSVIGINFTHSGTPTVLVKRNNLVIDSQTLTAFGSGRFIYNYYRFENDFNYGDLIEVFVADGENSRSHRYLVHYDGLESTFFFFENQHGVFEPFELIGRRRISSNYKHTLNQRYKNLFSFDEKLKTVNVQSFVVNSGSIHPEDHRVLDYMIKSEKIWCSFTGPNGNYVRVNCTTTKNLVSDTTSNNYDSDVEFQILENTDAIFCL